MTRQIASSSTTYFAPFMMQQLSHPYVCIPTSGFVFSNHVKTCLIKGQANNQIVKFFWKFCNGKVNYNEAGIV